MILKKYGMSRHWMEVGCQVIEKIHMACYASEAKMLSAFKLTTIIKISLTIQSKYNCNNTCSNQNHSFLQVNKNIW